METQARGKRQSPFVASPRRTRLRGAFALLAVAAGLATGQAWSASALGGGREALKASASIDFAVTVPRVLTLRLLDHPPFIDVSEEDVARGNVRVTGARLEVVVNDPAGYAIRAELSGPAFDAVRIGGLSSERLVGSQGATIAMPSMVGRARPRPMHVSYELRLAPGAKPGRYHWPVVLSLQQP